MPYTRTWNTNTPLGSLDADQIDDNAREKLVDIEERMNDILGTDSDMTDDPIVPPGNSLTELRDDIDTLNGSLGSVAGIKRSCYWAAGHITNEAGTVTYQTNRVEITGASATLSIDLPFNNLPVGVSITQAGILVLYQSTNHSVTATMRGTNHTGDVLATAFGAPGGASGTAQWVNATVTHTVLADVAYHITLQLANNNLDTATALGILQARVVITHPGGAVR